MIESDLGNIGAKLDQLVSMHIRNLGATNRGSLVGDIGGGGGAE